MGRAFVVTRFNRECVFNGWKHCCYTPDSMDIPGSQCNVESNRLMPFSFTLVITVSVMVICQFFWYLKVVMFKNLYLLMQLNIFGPATCKKFVIVHYPRHLVIAAYVELSVELLWTRNNEMSPSSVYGN